MSTEERDADGRTQAEIDFLTPGVGAEHADRCLNGAKRRSDRLRAMFVRVAKDNRVMPLCRAVQQVDDSRDLYSGEDLVKNYGLMMTPEGLMVLVPAKYGGEGAVTPEEAPLEALRLLAPELETFLKFAEEHYVKVLSADRAKVWKAFLKQSRKHEDEFRPALDALAGVPIGNGIPVGKCV